ncbi:MAG: hypothetical protein P8Y95_00945, partial [Gammaproteobacteria bacterium]
MRVESAAGAFELKFERIEPGDGDIVLTGQMGVWEAKTHITISEFFASQTPICPVRTMSPSPGSMRSNFSSNAPAADSTRIRR